MKKYQISETEKAKLVAQITYVVQEADGVSFAYIFGSFITGETFSDIDIGIYLNKYEPDKILEMEFTLENRLESLLHLPIDVRVINYAPLSFVYAVIRDGLVIVDKDSLRRADFEGLICRKYFDFAPFRREYLREVEYAPL